MERLLDRAPVLQLEAQRLKTQTSSIMGKIASDAEVPHITSEIKEEVETIRYGELVIGALQLEGRAENQSKLMKNMGYEYPQRGRRNNIAVAVDRLHELGLVVKLEEDGKSHKSGAIDLSELGRAYEVKPEVIEEIKTNSGDQNI